MGVFSENQDRFRIILEVRWVVRLFLYVLCTCFVCLFFSLFFFFCFCAFVVFDRLLSCQVAFFSTCNMYLLFFFYPPHTT